MSAFFYRRQHGFTMIELMVAMTMGLVITAGAVSLFLASKRSYNDIERSARLQENGRAALYFLTRDLRHVNFWGDLIDVSNGLKAPDLNMTGTCSGWASSTGANDLVSNRFVVSDNASADAFFTGCLNDIKANTSAVAIKRVRAHDDSYTSAGFYNSLDAGDYFLRSNSGLGNIIAKGSTQDTGALTAASEGKDWEYQPVIYFVRDFSVADGDGIPSLCKVYGNPRMTTRCLVEGVEFLHIEYGLDTNTDGLADTYQPNDAAGTLDMSQVITIRIYVLVRELEQDFAYTNTNTYRMGSKTVTFSAGDNDRYHRALFTTTVIPQNQRTLPITVN